MSMATATPSRRPGKQAPSAPLRRQAREPMALGGQSSGTGFGGQGNAAGSGSISNGTLSGERLAMEPRRAAGIQAGVQPAAWAGPPSAVSVNSSAQPALQASEWTTYGNNTTRSSTGGAPFSSRQNLRHYESSQIQDQSTAPTSFMSTLPGLHAADEAAAAAAANIAAAAESLPVAQEVYTRQTTTTTEAMLKDALAMVQGSVGEMREGLREAVSQLHAAVAALDTRVGIAEADIRSLRGQMEKGQDQTLARLSEVTESIGHVQYSMNCCRDEIRESKYDLDQYRDAMSKNLSNQSEATITQLTQDVSRLTQEVKESSDFEHHVANVLNKLQSDGRLHDEITRDGRERLNRVEAQVLGLHNSLRETTNEVILLRQGATRNTEIIVEMQSALDRDAKANAAEIESAGFSSARNSVGISPRPPTPGRAKPSQEPRYASSQSVQVTMGHSISSNGTTTEMPDVTNSASALMSARAVPAAVVEPIAGCSADSLPPAGPGEQGVMLQRAASTEHSLPVQYGNSAEMPVSSRGIRVIQAPPPSPPTIARVIDPPGFAEQYAPPSLAAPIQAAPIQAAPTMARVIDLPGPKPIGLDPNTGLPVYAEQLETISPSVSVISAANVRQMSVPQTQSNSAPEAEYIESIPSTAPGASSSATNLLAIPSNPPIRSASPSQMSPSSPMLTGRGGPFVVGAPGPQRSPSPPPVTGTALAARTVQRNGSASSSTMRRRPEQAPSPSYPGDMNASFRRAALGDTSPSDAEALAAAIHAAAWQGVAVGDGTSVPGAPAPAAAAAAAFAARSRDVSPSQSESPSPSRQPFGSPAGRRAPSRPGSPAAAPVSFGQRLGQGPLPGGAQRLSPRQPGASAPLQAHA